MQPRAAWWVMGWIPGVQMGPVISQASKERIEKIIGMGSDEGGTVCVDGRNSVIKGYENGSFIRPTIVANLQTTQ